MNTEEQKVWWQCVKKYLNIIYTVIKNPFPTTPPPNSELCIFFVYFFSGLECVGHSFAYVAHLWFLRDVWIRTQSAAVASWRATDLATQPSMYGQICLLLKYDQFFLLQIYNMLPYCCATAGKAPTHQVSGSNLVMRILHSVQGYSSWGMSKLVLAQPLSLRNTVG